MPDFEVTEPGVLNLLFNLKVHKSPGPDDLSPRVLREAACFISPVLCFIYNQSLSTGTLPDDWRIANIFALHKKGSKDNPENYRPISLTSVCSKLLEHIVYSSISRFLDSNNILTPNQHGFRQGHSCTTQLILAIQDWSKSLDDGTQTDVITFDFSKAFDKVPHHRLLLKLQYYGIHGNTLQWLTSFLSGRNQRVVLDGSSSSWSPVLSGVPQGTVLGPLLFLLYINDITTDINSDIRLFADDCILYRSIKSYQDLLILQQDINTLYHWSLTWQMQFNIAKCHSMSITRKRNKFETSYLLGNDLLSPVTSFTYLGIIVTSDMRWNQHISSVCSKATRTLNFIRRNVYNCTSEAKAKTYLSLVRPQLEYAAAAWDLYTSKNIQQLESVQNRAARFAKRDYRRTTSVSQLVSQLSWPSLADRRRQARLILFHKAHHGHSPLLLDQFPRNSNYTRLGTRGILYRQAPVRTDAYKWSFFPRTIRDWNSLSSLLHYPESPDVFKNLLVTLNPHCQ